MLVLLLPLALVIAGVWLYMESSMAPENAVVKRDAKRLREILVDTPERAYYKDYYGYSLMHLAALEDFPEGIALLAEAGVSVNATYSLSDAEIAALQDQATYENHRADYVVDAYRETEGMTPLHLAVIYHANRAVKELLRLGADANALTPRKESPLYWAAKSWNADAVTMLAASGADPRAQTQIGGFSPLHAVFNDFPGNPSLGFGEHTTQRLLVLYYPLNSAPEESRWKVIQALLEAGADPRQPDLRGQTAIDRCPPAELDANFRKTGPAERDESILHKERR
ncbi:MAG TPA: ankyrin repeat domain-containing protein [Candidatus Ozemobacteraceae bacterium]|nr:ankyrin repeat domain-containing protein [Candidatus Ozemobacteraceae bacterium]